MKNYKGRLCYRTPKVKSYSKPKPKKEKSDKTNSTMVIYALCCPLTFQPKYIGQTKNIVLRYRDHLMPKYGSQYKNEKKQEWVDSLCANKLKPYFTILEVTTLKNANEREQYWTIKYFNEGHALFNKKIGLFSPDKFNDLKL